MYFHYASCLCEQLLLAGITTPGPHERKWFLAHDVRRHRRHGTNFYHVADVKLSGVETPERQPAPSGVGILVTETDEAAAQKHDHSNVTWSCIGHARYCLRDGSPSIEVTIVKYVRPERALTVFHELALVTPLPPVIVDDGTHTVAAPQLA